MSSTLAKVQSSLYSLLPHHTHVCLLIRAICFSTLFVNSPKQCCMVGCSAPADLRVFFFLHRAAHCRGGFAIFSSFTLHQTLFKLLHNTIITSSTSLVIPVFAVPNYYTDGSVLSVDWITILLSMIIVLNPLLVEIVFTSSSTSTQRKKNM